jgi:hypothetical protein
MQCLRGEEKESESNMKKKFSKNLAILIVIVLVSSPLAIMPAFAADIQTTAYIGVVPNPVAPGQTATIYGWILPAPPSGFVYHNCYFGITAPSSAYQQFGPLSTDATGLVYVGYTPSEVGSYSIEFWMEDEVIGGDTYLGDSAIWNTALPLVATISPSSVTMDVGQSQVFNASVSGGTPPYSYYWYLDGEVVSGATGDTWTYTPSAEDVGSHNVFLLATDDIELLTLSNTVDVNVGEATGLIISNVVDVPPAYNWTYLLVQGETVVGDFILLPAGGSISFPGLEPGTYWLAQTRKDRYENATVMVDSVEVPATSESNATSVIITLLEGDTKSVVFTNTWIPDIAFARPAKADDSQPEASTYDMPDLKAVPVQMSWDPDIEPIGTYDLVKDRQMKIMVNLVDLLTMSPPLELADSVTVTVACDPSGLFDTVSKVTTGDDISSNGITIFDVDAPSATGLYEIICSITDSDGNLISEISTPVKVRETAPLSLYYSHLYRSGDYGTEPLDRYETMREETLSFVEAVYPVPEVIFVSNSSGFEGQEVQSNYYGILKDCQKIEEEAKLGLKNSSNVIGVAIVPYTSNKDNYFAYHGAVSKGKSAIGVSFGPAVKGVVVADGYYSAVAHEIGHTFGLYYGVPEQYVLYYPGAPANGFWVEQNEWRSGYDFMGISTYESTTSTWVSTDTTFEPLFTSLNMTDDPQIILVNGIIWNDGTVEFPDEWYKLPYGIPDTVPTGEYAIRFTQLGGGYVETSFAAQFFVNVDPGVEIGEDLPSDFTGFGTIPLDFAGFAFATIYPPNTDPDAEIEVVDLTTGDVIGRISGESVVPAPDSSVEFGGFVPPLNQGKSFKHGNPVPVKFQLTTPEGAYINNAQPTLFLSFEGSEPEIPATTLAQSTTDNLFHYDLTKNQYIFILDTSPLEKGNWQLRVYLGDGSTQEINIKLK